MAWYVWVAVATLAVALVVCAGAALFWGREVGSVGGWYWGAVSLVPLAGIVVLMVVSP